MKGETSASDFSILENDEYSGRGYKTSSLGSYMADKYRPSGFILKVELSLTKILIVLLRSMHLILKNEMKQGNKSGFIKELSYYHERTNERKLNMICLSIFDCIQYSLHCQKKWIANINNIYKLNKMLRCSSQFTDNLLESYLDIFDALNISSVSSELGLLLSMMLIKAGQISSYDINDESLYERIKELSEECKVLSIDKEKIIEAN